MINAAETAILTNTTYIAYMELCAGLYWNKNFKAKNLQVSTATLLQYSGNRARGQSWIRTVFMFHLRGEPSIFRNMVVNDA